MSWRHPREYEQGKRSSKQESVSTANYKAPWVYSVVTFLHKDVFKRPIRVDWAGQYTRKTMKHMLLGAASRVSSIPGSARYCWWGFFNANAYGSREGYSRGNETHMKRVDDQFQACVAAMKGTLISPRTPSWIDVSTGKGARLDHLVGLGVEFTCTSGAAAWVGSPFQDRARVSFAVKIGTQKPMARKTNDRSGTKKSQ